MTPRLFKALLCSLLLALATTARAQEQDPNAILDASKAAIAELDGFSAQFKMKGKGGSMFAATMPSMSGQLFFGDHDTYGRVIHLIGEIREQQSSPSKALDILLASDRYLWTDDATKTINEFPASGSTRGLPTAFSLVLLGSITQEEPFYKDINNAQAIELLPQETINGVLCDVIQIKRAKPDPRNRQAASDSYTDARWYIGVKDKLPRKVEHITDAGLIKITLFFELSNLRPGAIAQDQLTIPRPDGYTFKSRLPKPRAEQPVETPPSPVTNTPTRNLQPPPVVSAPSIRYAPNYSFTPVDGTEITNTTQADRITVLWFWGSWCVPCRAGLPLVSALAEGFDTTPGTTPVDVFGLAIREADPGQTQSNFLSQEYSQSLVLNVDELASAFEVRVYPTIVVINGQGEIVFAQSIHKETSTEELVERAKKAVEDLLSVE